MTELRPFSIVRSVGPVDRWPLYLSTIAFVTYFMHLSFNAIFVVSKSSDFRYFWVAGKVWSQGGSPYSLLFGTVKTALVGSTIADTWLYPPTWYPLCRVFAAMPLGFATKTWTALVLLSLFGGVIGWRAYRAVGGPLNQFWFTCLSIATVAAEPAFRTVQHGQTGAFIFLGVNLLLFGALRRNMVCAVLGAYLVMLKPSFGIPLCVAAVLMPGMWRSIAIAGAATILSMLPAFQTDTITGMLGGIARSMDVYRGFRFNAPVSLPGFFHFLDKVGIHQPSMAVMISASIVPILAAFGCLRLRKASREDTIISLFVVGVSSTLFFTLPHRYDLVCAYALAIVIWHFRLWLVVGLCVLPVVAFRTFDVNYLSLAAGITWCAAMATALLPRAHIIRVPLGGRDSDSAERGEMAPSNAVTA